MKIKKILFISAFPPNQKTAGQDYTRRLILDLLDKGHSVSIIYAEYPNHPIELPDSIKIEGIIKPSVLNCIKKLMFHPFFTRRFNKSLLSKIQSIASEFDMLYFDFSQVHIYSLYVDHPCKVLMCHDVICQKYTRKGRFQLPWIKCSEKKLLKTASKIITFSKKDSLMIKKAYNLDSISVNFYLKNGKFDYSDIDNKVHDNIFCFYGAWNRDENIECLEWFLNKVYPIVSSTLKFMIVGGGMSDNLKLKLSMYTNIEILGFVDDPVAEIAKTQALIAPLHKGAGVKVKVIDALSSGTVVIGTNVAFEGIEDNVENKLFINCAAPEEYAQILNNWKVVNVENKQNAATEFFNRYNTNHFTDFLLKMEN